MTRPRKDGLKRASDVGRNLKRIREKQGLSQQALADRSKVSRPTITNIETGGHADVNQATIKKLAGALKVKVTELVEPVAEEHPIDPKMIADFLASPWGAVSAATEAELDWLKGLPGVFWIGLDPAPEVLHRLILIRRLGGKSVEISK